MRKDEMNQKQLQEREAIVRTLAEAGWDSTAINMLFERDEPVRCEASMRYNNDTMELGVTYFARESMVYFEIYDHFGRGLDVAVSVNGNLPNLLDTITLSQDSISPQNYKNELNKLVSLFPDTYVDMDGQLVPLLNGGNKNA